MTQQTYHRPPRGKGRHNSNFKQRDIYNFYRKNRKHDCILTRETYYKILKSFNIKIMKQVIYNNNHFRMPYNLGHIRIQKALPEGAIFDENGELVRKDLVVNFGKTGELWERDPEAYAQRKKIYYTNDHTDGYIYHFHWYRKNARTKNITFYRFAVNSRWKQALKELLLDEDRKVDYYEQKKIRHV